MDIILISTFIASLSLALVCLGEGIRMKDPTGVSGDFLKANAVRRKSNTVFFWSLVSVGVIGELGFLLSGAIR
jgi:hypothetical protein